MIQKAGILFSAAFVGITFSINDILKKVVDTDCVS
jgi:hypothetical protein